MNPVELRPIGLVRSPHRSLADMPIQPAGAKGVAGRIELDPDLAPGLADLDGFSHIFLIYHLHESRGFELTVHPFLDETPRGVFATRAPRRPCPVGLSVLRLAAVKGATLFVLDVDVLDRTPVLDVKPYVPAFDAVPEARAGWLEESQHRAGTTRSDGRFRERGDSGP